MNSVADPRSQRPELSVLVPVYNEAATIGHVIRSHLALLDTLGIDGEILVIDDDSEDNSADEIGKIGDVRLRWWSHAHNEGIAPTLLELYRAAAGRWMYYVPADDQIPAEALERIWRVRDGAVCVVGRRAPRADPIVRRLIASTYSLVVRVTFGLTVHDIDSVKLISADVLRQTPVRARSTFSEAELLVRLQDGGGHIIEVPIPHRRRQHGVGRGAETKVIVATVLDLVRFAVRRAVH